MMEKSNNFPLPLVKTEGKLSVVNTRTIDVNVAIIPSMPRIIPGNTVSRQINIIPVSANKTIVVIT